MIFLTVTCNQQGKHLFEKNVSGWLLQVGEFADLVEQVPVSTIYGDWILSVYLISFICMLYGMDREEITATVFDAVRDAGYGEDGVAFIYVYGSFVREDYNPDHSDIDVCVGLDVENPARAEIRLSGRVPEPIDLSVFDALPVYVRKEVLKGDLIYRRDKTVYDKAFQTLREYEQFMPLYREAIGAT